MRPALTCGHKSVAHTAAEEGLPVADSGDGSMRIRMRVQALLPCESFLAASLRVAEEREDGNSRLFTKDLECSEESG